MNCADAQTGKYMI